MNLVGAVVVRWRGGDEVRRCLKSLLNDGGPRLGSVVLVDSGSGDGGAERLAAEFRELRVIALADNHGFAHAADCGAGQGSEPLLLLLNPDIEVQPGAIETLAALLDGRPRAAGAVPLLGDMDGSSQHRWQLRNLPTTARLACGLPGAPAFASPPAAVASVAQPAAAAWMVRRSVWDALGGLDPMFAPAWWEDVDFCARLDERLREAGFPADKGFVVEPRARFHHARGSSVSALGRTAFLEAYYRNLLRYASLHHRASLRLIRQGLRVSLALRMLLRPAERRSYRAVLTSVSHHVA